MSTYSVYSLSLTGWFAFVSFGEKIQYFAAFKMSTLNRNGHWQWLIVLVFEALDAMWGTRYELGLTEKVIDTHHPGEMEGNCCCPSNLQSLILLRAWERERGRACAPRLTVSRCTAAAVWLYSLPKSLVELPTSIQLQSVPSSRRKKKKEENILITLIAVKKYAAHLADKHHVIHNWKRRKGGGPCFLSILRWRETYHTIVCLMAAALRRELESCGSCVRGGPRSVPLTIAMKDCRESLSLPGPLCMVS